LDGVTVLVVLSLVVAVAALAVAAVVLRRTQPPRGDLDAVPEDVVGLRQEVAALRAEAKGSLRHVGLVRYDAFGDVGGRQSWSIALLDDAGDGVVLTAIHGRSEARSYAKSVAGWRSEQPLSPEEQDAVASART
jgi:membrane protein implicated in regulation of membrane protease activity